MRPITDSTVQVLTGLNKERNELKASHKRIVEYEAHIGSERQLISSKIETLQAKLALRRVQRKTTSVRGHIGSLSSTSNDESMQFVS